MGSLLCQGIIKGCLSEKRDVVEMAEFWCDFGEKMQGKYQNVCALNVHWLPEAVNGIKH